MRFICLFLLMFIVNDFTHTDETSFDVSLEECQSIEVNSSQEQSDSHGEGQKQNYGDGHCHHGHTHLVTLEEVRSSLEVKLLTFNYSFLWFESKSPKNILVEVNRPPIS